MDTKKLSRIIRPVVGLTRGQAAANLNYYNTVAHEEVAETTAPETAQTTAKLENILTNSADGDMLIMEQGGESVVNVLPNIDKMRIPAEKFTQYALNCDKSPDKALAFRLALGYTENDAQMLIENIKSNAANFKAIPKGNKGFGETYECIMSIEGKNGKTANVLTSWIVRDGESFPRLTNAYITNKKLR